MPHTVTQAKGPCNMPKLFNWIHIDRGADTTTLVIPGWSMLPHYFYHLLPNKNLIILNPFVQHKNDVAAIIQALSLEHNVTIKHINTTIGALHYNTVLAFSMGLQWTLAEAPELLQTPCILVSCATEYSKEAITQTITALKKGKTQALKQFYRGACNGLLSWKWWKTHCLDTHLHYNQTEVLIKWLQAYGHIKYKKKDSHSLTWYTDKADPIGLKPNLKEGTLLFHNTGHLIAPEHYKNIQNRTNLRFSKVANQYNAFASVQHKTAQYVLEALPHQNYNTVLDIGCGTGILTKAMAAAFPSARIDAVDISSEMVTAAAFNTYKTIQAKVCNYINTPMVRQYDCVVSNATWHWMDIVSGTKKLHHELQTGGTYAISIFGQHTAPELKECLADIGRSNMVSSQYFPEKEQIEGAFKPHFKTFNIKTHTEVYTFKSIINLLKSQKNTGVNAVQGQEGLWTPRQLKALEQAMIKRYGDIQLSYEVFIVNGKK